MELKIESGIPIPSIRNGRRPKIDLSLLEVGQSTFIKAGDTNLNALRARAKSKAYKSRNIEFVTRSTVEDGAQGIRFWRTA